MKLDSTDFKILKILQNEGRIRNTELAKRINLSATPCLERTKKLESEGLIQSYHAQLDRSALGFNFIVYIEITLDPNTTEAFETFNQRISSIDEVQECHLILGGHDYLIKVCLRDNADYVRFLGRVLANLPNIKTTRSYISVQEVKSTLSLPIT